MHCVYLRHACSKFVSVTASKMTIRKPCKWTWPILKPRVCMLHTFHGFSRAPLSSSSPTRSACHRDCSTTQGQDRGEETEVSGKRWTMTSETKFTQYAKNIHATKTALHGIHNLLCHWRFDYKAYYVVCIFTINHVFISVVTNQSRVHKTSSDLPLTAFSSSICTARTGLE